MKVLKMVKTGLGAGYWRYEIFEDGKVIASRTARREFIAAFIVRPKYHTETSFRIEKMFGRKELFEKALSKSEVDLYAIAGLSMCIQQFHERKAQQLSTMLDYHGSISIVAGSNEYTITPGSKHYNRIKNILSDFGCDHVALKLKSELNS